MGFHHLQLIHVLIGYQQHAVITLLKVLPPYHLQYVPHPSLYIIYSTLSHHLLFTTVSLIIITALLPVNLTITILLHSWLLISSLLLTCPSLQSLTIDLLVLYYSVISQLTSLLLLAYPSLQAFTIDLSVLYYLIIVQSTELLSDFQYYYITIQDQVPFIDYSSAFYCIYYNIMARYLLGEGYQIEIYISCIFSLTFYLILLIYRPAYYWLSLYLYFYFQSYYLLLMALIKSNLSLSIIAILSIFIILNNINYYLEYKSSYTYILDYFITY